MQDGHTPVYWASYNGHTDVVQMLLQNKADPNISNKVSRVLVNSTLQCCIIPIMSIYSHMQNGRTPVYWASLLTHTDVVQILLENNADPNISDKVINIEFSVLNGITLFTSEW